MTKLLENGMAQCLYCSHVWDGFAQCTCFEFRMISDSNDSENVCIQIFKTNFVDYIDIKCSFIFVKHT